MPVMLAFTTSERNGHAVVAASTALARALHLTVERRPLPTADAAAGVLRAIDDARAELVALPYSAGHAARLVTDVIQRCPRPVLVVPVGRRTTAPASIDRVLVPLDGTVPSADTVAETIHLFCACGADIVVLHVFDRTTVPKFWDHAEHARKSWVEEFLARYCNQPNARMELRSGTPGENILDVAASEHADLIALGWARNLSAGRARTVRATLARTTIPVLLLPRPTTPDNPGSWLPVALETALGQ